MMDAQNLFRREEYVTVIKSLQTAQKDHIECSIIEGCNRKAS